MKKWIEAVIMLMALAVCLACSKPMHELSRSTDAMAGGKSVAGYDYGIMLETETFNNDLEQPCGNALLAQQLCNRKPLVDLNAF